MSRFQTQSSNTLDLFWQGFDAFAFLYVGVLAKSRKFKSIRSIEDGHLNLFCHAKMKIQASYQAGEEKVLELNFLDTPMASCK